MEYVMNTYYCAIIPECSDRLTLLTIDEPFSLLSKKQCCYLFIITMKGCNISILDTVVERGLRTNRYRAVNYSY